MGGVEARLMHFASAYTNGDTIVYFANLKVVVVGKLLTSPVTKTDLQAFKNKLEQLVNLAIQLLNDGDPKTGWPAG